MMSSMFLAVSGREVNPALGLMPLLFERTRPRVRCGDFWLPEKPSATSSTILPSSSSSNEPGETSRGSFL